MRPERLAPDAGRLALGGRVIDKYDGLGAVNVCYILGNSPVRIWSVGWDDRPATDAELADMRAVVREAMQAGAWGLSTGLDYPPGSFAAPRSWSGCAAR